jgi:hypothetical protein
MTVFWNLYWWQWLALLVTVPAAWLLSRLLSRATRAVLGRITAHGRHLG